MTVRQFQPTTELFGPLFDEFVFRPLNQGSRMRELLRAPAADVVETDTEIEVVLDAPGLTPQDIDISLENNVLTISGERRSEWSSAEENNYTWHLSERRYGKFSRSFVLPRDTEQERIQARFENGVLNITIPKSERAQRRRIEIQSGDAQRLEVGAGS